MSDSTFAVTARSDRAARALPPAWQRGLVLVLALGGLAAGFLITGHDASVAAIGRDGAALTRVLRAMAALKMLFVLGATFGILWRLGTRAGAGWLLAYAAAVAVMWTGPGLIWSMAHVGLGALLMHGGLATSVVLLWRDKAVGARLDAMIARRRQEIRGRT